MLNERRLSFIHNNLFLKTSTHRNYSSVANTPNITVSVSAAELQDNRVKSFVQALRRLPQKNTTVTVYYHVAFFAVDLYVYLCLEGRRGGGKGVRVELSMYKMYRKFID